MRGRVLRKIIFFVIGAVVVLGVMFFQGKKQDEILNYINKDLQELSVIENQMIDSYQSVIGDNYSNDNTTLKEFKNNTVVLTKEFKEKTIEISKGLKNKNLIKTHKILMDYASTFDGAVELFISALEDKDTDKVAQANAKIGQADDLIAEFRDSLSLLAAENNIELKNE